MMMKQKIETDMSHESMDQYESDDAATQEYQITNLYDSEKEESDVHCSTQEQDDGGGCEWATDPRTLGSQRQSSSRPSLLKTSDPSAPTTDLHQSTQHHGSKTRDTTSSFRSSTLHHRMQYGGKETWNLLIERQLIPTYKEIKRRRQKSEGMDNGTYDDLQPVNEREIQQVREFINEFIDTEREKRDRVVFESTLTAPNKKSMRSECCNEQKKERKNHRKENRFLFSRHPTIASMALETALRGQSNKTPPLMKSNAIEKESTTIPMNRKDSTIGTHHNHNHNMKNKSCSGSSSCSGMECVKYDSSLFPLSCSPSSLSPSPPSPPLSSSSL